MNIEELVPFKPMVTKANTYLFGAGFFFYKLQSIPIPLASSILGFISYGLYIAAYALWFLQTLLEPSQTKISKNWYSFSQYKDQFALSAFIGFIASTLCIAAFFNPVLLIPSSILFLVSNVFWTLGEYHKYKNPPLEDEEYSHSYQSSYLQYSIMVTGVSLVAAFLSTLAFIFPPTAIPIMIISGIICFGMSMLAWHYWIVANYDEHPTLKKTQESYQHMRALLRLRKPVTSPEPDHFQSMDLIEQPSFIPLMEEILQGDSEIELNGVYSASI